MIKALLFDLDGTLFDTVEANIKSYSQAFKDIGLVFDKTKYREFFGLRFKEMMDQIAPHTTEQQKQEIKKLKSQYYARNVKLIKPNDGLISLLKSAKPHFKTALVSTASKTNVENILNFFLPEKDIFDSIITGEDVTHGKPDPMCYKLAAEKLGIDKSECLVYEDSDAGVLAAQAIAMKYVKVVL